MKIIQIDLMSLFHLNYKNKRTSLKDIQFIFNKNINDNFYNYDMCLSLDSLESIVKNSQNDITTIYELYHLAKGHTDNPIYKGVNELKLRSNIRKQFGLKCYNFPNVKIGEQLLLSLYCKSTGLK